MKIKQRIFSYIYRYKMQFRLLKNKDYQKFKKKIKVYSAYETIDKILARKLSVARYGDGEFSIMGGRWNGFQSKNPELGKRLHEVLSNPIPNMLLCIPSNLIDYSQTNSSSIEFTLKFLCEEYNTSIQPFLNFDIDYGDTLFTRFYMIMKDKSKVSEYVKYLKKIWNERDLLIVEGVNSRLGVGNDLFDNAGDIRRILCPPTDAFDRYDQILETSKKNAHGRLVIIALGMTATVLAYDLCKFGIQAMDLGHVDVEYEWFLMEATHKVALPNKAVNEVGNNKNVPQCTDPKYKSSVLAVIE